jgi:hypothetical protein
MPKHYAKPNFFELTLKEQQVFRKKYDYFVYPIIKSNGFLYKKQQEIALIQKENKLLINDIKNHTSFKELITFLDSKSITIRKDIESFIAPEDLDTFKFIMEHLRNDTQSVFYKCPNNDCIGVIYTSFMETSKCVICDTIGCNNCHEKYKDVVHVCDQDIITSLNLIKDDSRKCPTCKIFIYKIDGCDDMNVKLVFSLELIM